VRRDSDESHDGDARGGSFALADTCGAWASGGGFPGLGEPQHLSEPSTTHRTGAEDF
jgi:hypothetical protein